MKYFDGSFEYLPLRAQLDIGMVPHAPTSDDFQLAVSRLRAAEDDAGDVRPVTWRVAAARWFVEAVRERRAQPGADIGSNAVMSRVAKALHAWTTEAA